MSTVERANLTRLRPGPKAAGSSTVAFSILGPLEVVVDGRPLVLGSAKERVLLVRLLLSPNHVVAVDTLIEDLWGSCTSEQVAANLRVYVSRLRKRLRDAGGGREVIYTRAPGYVLEVEPESIDAVRCERAATRVRELLSAGAFEEAASRAREALAMWRGPALGEAVAYLFAQPEAARLDELQRTLVEDRIDADLARGLDAELVGELTALVDRHPYRERLWKQLMLALYRAGRQVEALRAFERVRTHLGEDLGISPSPELADLERDILNHAPDLRRCTRPDPASAPAPQAPPTDRTSRGVLVCRGGSGAASHQHLGLVNGVAGVHRATEVSSGQHEVRAFFPSAADALRCAADVVRAARRAGVSLRAGAHGTAAAAEIDDLRPVAEQLSYLADTGEVLVSEELAELARTVGVRVATSGDGEGLRRRVIVDQDRPRPSESALPGGPVVGREAELVELLSTWERACAGGLQLSAVSGEAGIGKTALTRKLAERCWEDGGVVLNGRCDETMVIPYQPFLGAARQYLAQREPKDLAIWGEPGTADLVDLVGGCDDAPPADSGPVDEVTRRFRLFDAFVALFREVSQEAPLLLILDDVHWADGPTLRLLRHLVEQGQELAVHVVVTYRTDEAGPTTPLADTLGEIARIQRFEVIPLTGLRAEALTALMVAWSGSCPDPEVVCRLLRETEGNPLFVEELVRQAAELDGPVAVSMRAPHGPDDFELAAPAVPQRIKAVIRRRTSRLPEVTRSLLETASVLGSAFTIDVLEALADLDDDALAAALDLALEAGLVKEEEGAFGGYAFTHVLIRHCLYEGIGPARRNRLHHRAGHLLLDRHGFEAGPFLRDIARHLVAGVVSAEDKLVASDAAMACGRAAAANMAFEEARDHYQRALELLRSARSGDIGKEVAVLVRLAEANARAGDVVASSATLAEAAAVGRRAGAGELLARIALAYGAELWNLGWTTRGDSRIDLLQEALASLIPRDSILHCRLLQRLAIELHQAGDRDACVRLASEAVDLAQRLDNPELLAGAKEAELIALLGADLDPEVQLRRSEEIVAIAQKGGSRRLVIQARQLRHAALLQLGDLGGFAEETAAAAATAASRAVPTLGYWMMVQEAMLHTTSGDFRRAEVRATEAFIAGQRIDEATATSVLGPQLAIIAWARGRLGPLVEPTRSLAERFPDYPIHRATLAFVCALAGDSRAAAEFDWFAAGGLDRVPRDDQWLTTMYLLAMAGRALDDRVAAGLLFDRLAPYASRVAAPANGALCLGSVATAVGLAARTAGHTEDALCFLIQAEMENRRMGARPFLALTLLEQAACHRTTGADERAKAIEKEARALMAAMEMSDLALAQ